MRIEILLVGSYPKDWHRVIPGLLLAFAPVESSASQYALYIDRSALSFDAYREEICLTCNLCVVLLAAKDVEV